MTSFRRALPTVLAGGLLLQACASTTPALSVSPTAADAAAVKRAKGSKPVSGTMAPIANPPEEARPAPRPHEAAEPGRAPQQRLEPARPEPPTTKPEPAKPPPESKSAVDRQRAAKLRAQGLTRLNGGAVDRAVALLQQAAQLDPDNPLIRRDLERAMRISRLVHQPK